MPNNATSACILGYHGTDRAEKENIIRNNFRESIGRHHWLENGVYFFVEGISDSPIDDASNWAIAQAWDNDKKRFQYTEYVVFEAQIKFDRIWDLTTQEGLKMFNYARTQIIRKIGLQYTLEPGAKQGYYDADVIEVVRKRLKFQVVKANVYIKFTFERKKNIISHIPNVTIISVSNPKQAIEKSCIKVVKQGVASS